MPYCPAQEGVAVDGEGAVGAEGGVTPLSDQVDGSVMETRILLFSILILIVTPYLGLYYFVRYRCTSFLVKAMFKNIKNTKK